MSTEQPFDVDESYRIARNDVRITHNTETDVWLVSRYPIRNDDPGYPGYTYDSTAGECPHGPDLATMRMWVRLQPWSYAAAA